MAVLFVLVGTFRKNNSLPGGYERFWDWKTGNEGGCEGLGTEEKACGAS